MPLITDMTAIRVVVARIMPSSVRKLRSLLESSEAAAPRTASQNDALDFIWLWKTKRQSVCSPLPHLPNSGFHPVADMSNWGRDADAAIRPAYAHCGSGGTGIPMARTGGSLREADASRRAGARGGAIGRNCGWRARGARDRLRACVRALDRRAQRIHPEPAVSRHPDSRPLPALGAHAYVRGGWGSGMLS